MESFRQSLINNIILYQNQTLPLMSKLKIQNIIKKRRRQIVTKVAIYQRFNVIVELLVIQRLDLFKKHSVCVKITMWDTN